MLKRKITPKKLARGKMSIAPEAMLAALAGVVGIDVSKAKFNACYLAPAEARAKHGVFSADAEGHRKFLCWLERVGAGEGVLICLEETGCYGRALAAFLHEAGHHVSLVNAAYIKHFGKSLGQRSKNDRIDAHLIAQYACARRPKPWIPLAPCHQKLRDAARRRAQLIELMVKEKNHLEASACEEIKADIRALINALQLRIAAMFDHMKAIARSEPGLCRNLKLLISIPGLGEVTALLLLAELPPMDAFKNARQISAFAGLTPKENKSGSSLQGKTRLCKQGRGVLRKILFMPVVSLMAKKTGPLRRFIDRLLTNSKPKMCVMGALMRKLVCLAFAILRSGRPFDPNYRGPVPAH